MDVLRMSSHAKIWERVWFSKFKTKKWFRISMAYDVRLYNDLLLIFENQIRTVNINDASVNKIFILDTLISRMCECVCTSNLFEVSLQFFLNYRKGKKQHNDG